MHSKCLKMLEEVIGKALKGERIMQLQSPPAQKLIEAAANRNFNNTGPPGTRAPACLPQVRLRTHGEQRDMGFFLSATPPVLEGRLLQMGEPHLPVVPNWQCKVGTEQSCVNLPGASKKDGCSTRCSKVVTHLSTSRARTCLASQIGRDEVCYLQLHDPLAQKLIEATDESELQ